MPLFVCSTPDCFTIENTALVSSYWAAVMDEPEARRPVLCSACETGQWHDRFPRRRYNAETDGPIDPILRRLQDR